VEEDPLIVELYYDVLDLQSMVFSSMESEIYLLLPSKVKETLSTILTKSENILKGKTIRKENILWARMVMMLKVLIMMKEHYIPKYFERYYKLWEDENTKEVLEDIGLIKEDLTEEIKEEIISNLEKIISLISHVIMEEEYDFNRIKNYTDKYFGSAIKILLSRGEKVMF